MRRRLPTRARIEAVLHRPGCGWIAGTQIATRLGLDRSTANTILAVMVSEDGYERRRVELGAKAYEYRVAA